jgi:nitrate reductase gamma subunit
MTGPDFLLWVRGPALEMAAAVFAFGMVLRLVEILTLGRKPELAEKRDSGVVHGLRTILQRFLPIDAATARRSLTLVVAGYVFHIGLLAVIFLLAPHIQTFKSLVGLSWPAAPTPLLDLLVVLAMGAMLVLLWRRVTDPVARYLSDFEDYLVWLVTFLPLITGYMSFHHLLLPYQWMLGIHILTVEALLVVFPFTKLTHAITFMISRYYTGFRAGEKGVQI